MKVILKAMAGSHLFGTNTETSDKDYKGIYLPSAKEILLGSYSESVQHSTGNPLGKNTKEDVDTELYSVKKFLKMVSNGDTAALELLFTPDNMILEKTEEWDFIKSYRDKLLSSKVTAMIGYARQQANKYGIKGSRMGELSQVNDFFKSQQKKLEFNAKLKHCWEDINIHLQGFNFVHFIELDVTNDYKAVKEPAIEILGKKFGWNTPLNLVCKNISDTYKNYGQRAREAKANNGVDFKALSHAVRVTIQGIELLKTGSMNLPHTQSNLELIRDIKLGRIHFEEVSQIITDSLEVLEKAREESLLPKEVDQNILDEILMTLHRKVLNE
jgi:hypothetical protein